MSRPAILVIRRDNIGDLICTTPLLAALRQTYPQGWLGVLANSYNAPVLEGNPDLDAVCSYHKLKHGGVSALGAVAERISLVRDLRRRRLDWVVIATPAWQPRSVRLARWFAPARIAAFVPPGATPPGIDAALPLADVAGHSEVELVYRLAGPLGIPPGAPPAVRVVPAADALARARQAIGGVAGTVTVGLHLSARKPSQRWPVERFAELMRTIHAAGPVRFAVFWAPGASDDPRHPGDDGKARALEGLAAGLPVTFWRTESLRDLIAGIAACDLMVMGDGGAMHIAAGLGRPIVCLFGRSDAARWRPWGVPCRLLQPVSQDVADVTVAEVASAYTSLVQSAHG